MQESKVCKSIWSLPGLNPISLNQQFALFPARHLNNTNKLTTRKSFHFQQYLSSHKICVINYAYPDSMQRSQYHIFIFFIIYIFLNPYHRMEHSQGLYQTVLVLIFQLSLKLAGCFFSSLVDSEIPLYSVSVKKTRNKKISRNRNKLQ